MKKMNKATSEKYVEALFDCFCQGSVIGYAKVLNELLEYQALDAATVVENTLLRALDHSYHCGDQVAVLMEMAIRKNEEWALVNGDYNPLVQSIIKSGSMDLYDCYTELVEGLTKEWYSTLLANLAKMNMQVLSQYEHVLLTRDFNSGLEEGAFRRIHEEDYQKMFLVTQRYNRLVGIYKLMVRVNGIVNENKNS